MFHRWGKIAIDFQYLRMSWSVHLNSLQQANSGFVTFPRQACAVVRLQQYVSRHLNITIALDLYIAARGIFPSVLTKSSIAAGLERSVKTVE